MWSRDVSQIINVNLSENNVVTENARQQAVTFRETFTNIRREIQNVFVGQQELIDLVLTAFIADGHVLIEGVPGLGKTLLVRTLAAAANLSFSRIQFTPDLMPADITGATVLAEKSGGGHELRFETGPVVANIVLADEINRATPKTQSALLEAMQERHVTVGGKTLKLPDPFIVLATQNPVEQEGTYPLPEAQLDRFMIKAVVDYPTEHDYLSILERTTNLEQPQARAVLDQNAILSARRIVRQVPVGKQVATYAIRLVMATQPKSPYASSEINHVVALGASPRAVQSLLLMAKVRALLAGRFAVSCQDIRDVAHPVLRHRIVLNYTGLAEKCSPDALIRTIVASQTELSE